MAKYRQNLPQLGDAVFLTDSGLETTLVYLDGIELPFFAAFDLLRTRGGRARLRAYYDLHARMAARAGAPFDVGRDSDGLVQPMTLMFRMGEFERAAFAQYVAEHPDQWRGVHGLSDLVRRAAEAGELNLAREDILFFGTPHPREVSVNSTRVTRVLGSDVFDLTRAEFESRRQLRQLIAFFRRYVPGFEESYCIQSGVQVGVRETRRIVGRYQLTADDVMNARKFEDVVARGSYPVDIHNPTGKGTILKKLPPDESYDIPLRCLIPQRLSNLLVAGRCISGTHEAHSSYRVMPIAMATGHAAGHRSGDRAGGSRRTRQSRPGPCLGPAPGKLLGKRRSRRR